MITLQEPKSPLRIRTTPVGAESSMSLSLATNPPHGPQLERVLENPPNSPKHKPLVDLTDNVDTSGKDSVESDIQKAIKLSLQDQQSSQPFGAHFSQEDQEISKALEESLMKSGTSNAQEGFQDPLNPHDRERQGLVSCQSLECTAFHAPPSRLQLA